MVHLHGYYKARRETLRIRAWLLAKNDMTRHGRLVKKEVTYGSLDCQQVRDIQVWDMRFQDSPLAVARIHDYSTILVVVN